MSCLSGLLRQFGGKSHLFNFYFRNLAYNYRLFSTVIADAQKISSVESIKVSKYLQPIINHPIEKLLSTVDLKFLSINESIILLKALRMHILFKGADSTQIKNDARFKTLCQVFENNCEKMDPNMLISGLRSLLEVGVPPDASCVISAENSIIKKIQQFTVFNLIGCLYFHHKFMQTELQKNVVQLLIEEIQNKWSKISNTAEILMLVHYFTLFDEEHRKKLEKKIFEFIPLLNSHEMCKVMCTLAENSNRNIFILNAIAFNLQQKEQKPGIKESVDILYAAKKLNYCDSKFLSYLLNYLIPEIPSIKQPAFISGILTSCGSFRWKYPVVLDACGQWILEHLDSCRTREFVSYILATAALNYSTGNSEIVVNTILPHLTPESVKSPEIWLDIVWCLAILDKADKQLLQNVVSTEFYKELIDASDFRSITNKLKLMNLKAVLQRNHPECIFGCNLFFEPTKTTESADVENCRKHVLSVLSNFVPQDKYLCTNQDTDMGIFIDAEFIMDMNIKPLPLLEYGIMAKATDVTKPVPKGYKRIAFLILFHKDYTLNIRDLTGVNALSTRLLSAQGYTVVHIPYAEFSKNKTEVQKAKYLVQKIRDVME